jgi:hypothetical protein
MSNKEDIALYIGLFGLYLAVHRGEGANAGEAFPLRGPLVMALALLWLIAALVGLDHFGGPERVDWVRMWSEETPFSERGLRPSGLLILAFAGLPLLNIRLTAIVIAPILIFHLISQQTWHHNYLGHYSYAILPFLMFGAIRGYQRLESLAAAYGRSLHRFAGPGRVAGMAVLACSFFAASADRYMPLPGLTRDPRFQVVEATLAELPPGACLQTQSPFSAHAPLDVQVYPLMIHGDNPAYETMPGPHNFDRFHFDSPDCNGYYLFLDVSDPAPPNYSAEHLEAFANFARRNLLPVKQAGKPELYRLPVFAAP